MSPTIQELLPGGSQAVRNAFPALTDAVMASLAPRLRSGAVLWDLRPIHEVQRTPIRGAVNLGQVDWLAEDPASGRLQPPSVIAKILARAGIVAGGSVILYAGARTQSLLLARRALLSIAVDQIEVVLDDEDEPPMMRGLASGSFRNEAIVASAA